MFHHIASTTNVNFHQFLQFNICFLLFLLLSLWGQCLFSVLTHFFYLSQSCRWYFNPTRSVTTFLVKELSKFSILSTTQGFHTIKEDCIFLKCYNQLIYEIITMSILTKFCKFVQQSVSGENQRSKTYSEYKSPLYSFKGEPNYFSDVNKLKNTSFRYKRYADSTIRS